MVEVITATVLHNVVGGTCDGLECWEFVLVDEPEPDEDGVATRAELCQYVKEYLADGWTFVPHAQADAIGWR